MIKHTPFLVVLTCALAAGWASAQNAASPRTAVRASAPVIPALPWSSNDPAPTAPSFSVGLTPTLSAPSLSAPAPTRGLSMLAPGALAVVARPVASALTAAPAPYGAVAAIPIALSPVALMAPSARTAAATSALSVLSAASVADDAPTLFDGAHARNGAVTVNTSPARTPRLAAGRVLMASGGGTSSPYGSVARTSLLRRAAAVAGLIVAVPTTALASGAPVASAYALALVTDYHPLAAAIAVTIGALFGLWASRSKDDSPANAGQVFASVLSHGAIAGAGVFALLDLTKVLFLGTAAVGLTSLTAAVATAALAQAAFTTKFLKPTTASSDRIIGAFPAVAAAFGLSLGVAALAAPTGMLALGTAALALTGAATALFVALFKPERSPAGGPAAMGRGFVLQTLMTGLALAVGDPRYAVFFFALGMWGFASVLIATAREAWSALPESVRKRFAR